MVWALFADNQLHPQNSRFEVTWKGVKYLTVQRSGPKAESQFNATSQRGVLLICWSVCIIPSRSKLT